MRHTAASTIFALVFSCGALAAHSPTDPSVEDVLDRMGAYLESYESQLMAITADEAYEQREVVRLRGNAPRYTVRARRRLESDVAFVRLPGTGEWAGFRAVHRVDGKAVTEGGIRLSELLSTNKDVIAQAVAITTASSKYNLGTPRTTNMPTVPLEVFHPRHRSRFSHRLDGTESIRGARTVRVVFEETGSPTVIRRSEGGDVKSSGSAWVEPDSGKVWRAEVIFRETIAPPKPSPLDVKLRVEFGVDRRLETMVPIEMLEVFYVSGARGDGKATYTNFKRFETGARLVP